MLRDEVQLLRDLIIDSPVAAMPAARRLLAKMPAALERLDRRAR